MKLSRAAFGLAILLAAFGCDRSSTPACAPAPLSSAMGVSSATPTPPAPDATDATDAMDASVASGAANATNASWRALVTGRMPVLGAAWTKGGAAVIATQTDIWTIDPTTPNRAHVTPFSQPIAEPLLRGRPALLAARENSDVVAVAKDDGSVDVLAGSPLVRIRTLPPIAKGMVMVDVQLAADGQSLRMSAQPRYGNPMTRIFDLRTWTSKAAPTPKDSAPLSSASWRRPYRTLRADGAFDLSVDDGVQIVEAATGRTVLRWGEADRSQPTRIVWRNQAIEVVQPQAPFFTLYRFGGAPPPLEAGAPPAPPLVIDARASCGRWPELVHIGDGSAMYTTQDDHFGGVCYCTKAGCQVTWLKEPQPGPSSEPLIPEVAIGAADDGAFLSKTTADEGPINVISLHRADGRIVKTRQAALHCEPVQAAFVGGRIFVTCEADDRPSLLELSAKNLSVLARRAPPAVACTSQSLEAIGDKLFYGCKIPDEAVLLDADWVKEPAKVEDGHLYIWGSLGILARADGKVAIAGNAAEAEARIQCFDGENLAPFATCKDAVLVKY